MSPRKEKKEFNWEAGNRLSPDIYDPLGNVRDAGFAKLADGIYADPQSRKEARGKKLSRKTPPKNTAVFVEESASGLKDDYTPSEARHLISKETKGIKGILRFKKPPKKK